MKTTTPVLSDPAVLREVLDACRLCIARGEFPSAPALARVVPGRGHQTLVAVRDALARDGLLELPPRRKNPPAPRVGDDRPEWGRTEEERRRVEARIAAIREEKIRALERSTRWIRDGMPGLRQVRYLGPACHTED